jgi:hypothetical protein
MRILESHIDINATPDQVWAVLTDFAAFAEWNPFLTAITGAPAAGSRLAVRFCPPEARAMTLKPTVTAYEPSRHLAWLGHFVLPHIFDGAHEFTLASNGRGGTTFTQRETFRGALVPFFAGTLARTLEGFEQMNQALKQRAESRADAPS